jgi:hypothetical protein
MKEVSIKVGVGDKKLPEESKDRLAESPPRTIRFKLIVIPKFGNSNFEDE